MGSIYRERATRKISLLRKEVLCFRPFAEDVSGVVDRLAGGWSAQKWEAAEGYLDMFPKVLGFPRCLSIYGPPQSIGR